MAQYVSARPVLTVTNSHANVLHANSAASIPLVLKDDGIPVWFSTGICTVFRAYTHKVCESFDDSKVFSTP